MEQGGGEGTCGEEGAGVGTNVHLIYCTCYTMLDCITLQLPCYAALYHVTLCYAALYHVTLCYAAYYTVISCYTIVSSPDPGLGTRLMLYHITFTGVGNNNMLDIHITSGDQGSEWAAQLLGYGPH